ncbi:riboflavin synthase [Acidaminobacter hydrogenoformans]|uniref:Riboflavin synthase n=1 Tax=Acidaminobacter hydrogenoformans DSM 2784 TaxID=1120920 RepID=A0A1G5RV88_9FIRM|nr:riboflavin synthase [Acidaminobacter hydrogenoformans]SCZ77371.1 riboflavin synthase alpha chain [Acidaminobacter hydrogenoformans DSM 2784]
MFTGIIEEIGIVERIEHAGPAAQLTVRAARVLEDVKNGDSICTNGVCLTVVRFTKESFTADVMPETLRYSNLGGLKQGSPVNLERAMSAQGRFGGHMVSGHIDGVGVIRSLRQEGNATWMTVSPPAALMRYVIQKGSIAMDGTSLTVAQLEESAFSVSIIPVTKDETILLKKRVGDQVNLECDLVGKYVERLLQFGPVGAGDSASEKHGSLNMDFLKENGFA